MERSLNPWLFLNTLYLLFAKHNSTPFRWGKGSSATNKNIHICTYRYTYVAMPQIFTLQISAHPREENISPRKTNIWNQRKYVKGHHSTTTRSNGNNRNTSSTLVRYHHCVILSQKYLIINFCFTLSWSALCCSSSACSYTFYTIRQNMANMYTIWKPRRHRMFSCC